MSSQRIYLDYASGAPLAAVGREELLRLLDQAPANPGAPHLEGRHAKDALEDARGRAAQVLERRPREVLFTASATQAAETGLMGLAHARRSVSRHIVTTAIEHEAVAGPLRALAAAGFEVETVPVERDGRVDPERFLAAVRPDTALAAMMAVNHECGVIQPLEEVLAPLRERQIPTFCDAAMAPGRLAADGAWRQATVFVLSGPKFGAPAGSGLLALRRSQRLETVHHGGLQEERLNPGRENVAAWSALATTLESVLGREPEERRAMHASLWRIVDAIDKDTGLQLVSKREHTAPGIVTLAFPRIEGEALMINLDLMGIAVATGSTCALGGSNPSPSLIAMGMSRSDAASTIRLSIGNTLDADTESRVSSSIAQVVQRLRALTQW